MKLKELLPILITRFCRGIHIHQKSTDEFNIINFQDIAFKKTDVAYDIVWETTNFGKEVLKKFENCEVKSVIPYDKYIFRIEVY